MDMDLIVRGAFALAAVVLSLGVFWGLNHVLQKWRGHVKRGRYLKVLETLPLDPKRRLVLVQCDTRVYLLLLGGATDFVVDRFEKGATPRTQEHSDRVDPYF
ncbi:MAG: flagellar biosynthetic protein FliO [Holosporales bacterium]|nr:flagellar biosynthetic protein FliO [Holosporales bacterium]